VAELLADLSGSTTRPRLDTSTLDALETEVRRTTRDRRAGARQAKPNALHQREETA
jgi:hypothetical protein